MGDDAFTPGSFWDADRARESVARMRAVYDSEEFQSIIAEIADSGPPHTEPPAEPPASLPPGTPVTIRRATEADVPRLIELIAAADLPPLFVGEFVGGFAVAEAQGEIVACGGGEVYDDCGVIRSVVVDPRARGCGLGRRISELLVDDLLAAGARDIYLFTAEAHEFWLHLGFTDIDFDDWRAPAQQCWQYRFLETQDRDVFSVYTLWKPA